MNPFFQMTTVLAGQSCWPTRRVTTIPGNKTERMRTYLRMHGRANAITLADEANLPKTALVSALLKADLKKGSVFIRGDQYHWNHQFDAELQQRLTEAASLLRANGYHLTSAPP